MSAGLLGAEATGTYTLKAWDNRTAIIEVNGKRSKSDGPILQEQGGVQRATTSDGTRTAKVKIDPRTGNCSARSLTCK